MWKLERNLEVWLTARCGARILGHLAESAPESPSHEMKAHMNQQREPAAACHPLQTSAAVQQTNPVCLPCSATSRSAACL